jgi:4-amino-4-deoxy-L-arabinose transferase-like glycosyltransferase
VRGDPAEPAWSRPALLGVGALAGLLMCWSLTSNGYGNPYYAEAVSAGTQSWSAFFGGALDVSGYVGFDKTPLAIWMMALSGRVFGFSSLSMLLPNALCGVASVLVLHNVVKRTLGPRAAIIAALMLALSPVAVLMARFNNPDALLVLLLVCSAWAAVRAVESGRTRHIVLCGVLVGLAFNTKMLQAYLVVPALALTFLVAAPGSVRRRLAQLAAGAAAMLAVSAAWVVPMSLVPASQRPWVADTTSNSWWDLIVNANGLDRASGGTGPGAGGFGGNTGVLRLFNEQIGGQIAWLLPLAAVGLLVGLWLQRRAPRTDPARASYVLWGTWALVTAVVFSSLTVLHPYYMSALAPAVAALAAGGLVALWDRSSTHGWAVGLLAASLAGSGVLAFALLDRTPSFAPWVRWTVLLVGIVAALAVLVWRLAPRSGRRLAFVAIAGGAAAVLAGPAAYSIATVDRHYGGGGPPNAGPATAAAGLATALGGGGPPAGLAAILGGAGARGGPPAGLAAILGGKGPGSTDKRLNSYLVAHRGGARYLVAAEGSLSAAPIALSTRQPVITMGGFMGGDPAPSASELRGLVRSGQVRYVLLGGLGNLIAAGGPPGGGGSRRDRAGVQARQRWVTANCRPVSYGGAGHGPPQSLYDCSGASAA